MQFENVFNTVWNGGSSMGEGPHRGKFSGVASLDERLTACLILQSACWSESRKSLPLQLQEMLEYWTKYYSWVRN